MSAIPLQRAKITGLLQRSIDALLHVQQTHGLCKMRTHHHDHAYRRPIGIQNGHVLPNALLGATVDLEIILLLVDRIVNDRS